MSESRGAIFTGVKYTLLASYALNCIVCIIYIVGGAFMVSSSHMNEISVKEPLLEISDVEPKSTKIHGYIMATAGAIGIGLTGMGIYAVYKEIYKLNFWLTFFALIGLILTLFTQTNPVAIVIQTLLTGCSVYFTMILRQSKDYSIDDNPELGKVKPDENTAMVSNAYKE